MRISVRSDSDVTESRRKLAKLLGVSRSRNDRRRGIRIPIRVNERLAEAVGIWTGDGHIRKQGTSYSFKISGHLEEDRPYLLTYVAPLYKELFNIRPSISENRDRNELTLQYSSKVVYMYFTRVQGLPIGRKGEIGIPQSYRGDASLLRRYLRGLLDTDGTVTFKRPHQSRYHYYPIIEIELSSRCLIQQVAEALREFGFNCYVQYDKKNYGKGGTLHRVGVQGVDNLVRWVKVIGSMNPKHLTKILIWCRYGFCPPHTTLKERLAMLRKSVDPLSYYDAAGGHTKAHELLLRERRILNTLLKYGPQTTRELSERLRVHRSTMKKTLRRLLRRGKLARFWSIYRYSKYGHGRCYRWLAKGTTLIDMEEVVEKNLRNQHSLL